MGFAAGVRAGTSLVDSILQEKRANEEFGWKRDDRTREVGIRQQEDELTADNIRLIRDGQQPVPQAAPRTAGIDVPAASAAGVGGPGADVAQGASGYRAGAVTGTPTQAVGSPTPTVPAGPANAADAIAGTATAATPAVQATPQAGPQDTARKLGREELIQRNLQQQALLRGKAGDYNTARQNERATGIQQITDESVKSFMAMPQEEKEKLAYSPNLTGDIPLMTLSTDKNGMTVVPIDPKTGRPVDNGKPIKLSWSDAAQLHAANELGKAGFGAEAIDAATKANARIGESLKAINAQTMEVQKANNDAAYKGGSLAETGRHNRATEANQAAQVGISRERLNMDKDKAKSENSDIVSVSPEGIITIDKKSHRMDTQPWPEGTTEAQKAAYIKKYAPVTEQLKVNPDGTIQVGNRLFERQPDPNNKGKFRNVEITPGAQSSLDKFIASKTGGGGAAAAPAGAVPAADAPRQALPAPPPTARQQMAAQAQKEAAARQDPDLNALLQQYRGASGRQQAMIGQQIRDMRMQRYNLESSALGF